MKKVIAILTILVIATVALFAASETHTIKITVDIATVTPAFQLFIGNDSVVTNNGNPPVPFTNNAPYAPNAQGAGYDTGWDGFNASRSVSVTARVANAAQIEQTYTLSFSDGVFTVVRAGSNSTTHAPSISVAQSNNQVPTGITSITIDHEDAAVVFSGAQCTSGTNLVTATYTYSADTTIVPGTYSANIVMTVTEGVLNNN